MRFRNFAPAALSAAIIIALAVAALPARALPPPAPPEGRGSPEPSATPFAGAVLPVGSTLLFVLDQKVSSATTPAGSTIKMHLKDALVVNGVTVAPAGAPATFTVVSTRKSASGDQDGAIQVHLDPLSLAGGGVLPIRAYHEYLTVERSGGQLATRSSVDTVGDIFIPYYLIYSVFRKGQQYVLPPGAVLRAETSASVDASDPHAVAVRTPPPFSLGNDPVHADYTPVPLFTYVPTPTPTKRGKPTPKPTMPPPATDPPSPAATALASPTASARP